jgi:hypothetical protein
MLNRALQALIDGAPSGTTQVVAGGAVMSITKVDGLAPVVTFPRDAVLDKEHLALAFRVGVGAVKKMDLPCIWIGIQQKYIYGQVLDHIAKKAMENAA